MAIRSKNLNLIPILQALLNEESVARAANQIGLSQPAMSGALGRLRELLNDPLLVRAGRSMQLTPRAHRMRKSLDEVCAQIELLFQPETFDPSTAKLGFRVAAPDYLSFLITGHLLEWCSTHAPGIRIDFVDVPGDLPHWMESGAIDLAVCADLSIWPELRKEHLFRDRYVAAVAKNHPLAKQKQVTSEELLEFPSPSLVFDASFNNRVRPSREPVWVTGIPAFDFTSQISSMSQFNGVLLATRSPMIARLPASLAEGLREILPLAVVEISDANAEFDTALFWTAVTDEALEHKWLRQKLKECFAETRLTTQCSGKAASPIPGI